MLIDFIVGVLVTLYGGLIMSVSTPKVSLSLQLGLGATVIILGVLSVVVGYGLWKAKAWAWLLGLWAGVAYVALGVFALSPLILLVGIGNLIFYYFKRTGLKLYLGKVQP